MALLWAASLLGSRVGGGCVLAFAQVGAAQRRNNKSCQENELAVRKDTSKRRSSPCLLHSDAGDEELEKHKLDTTKDTRTGRSPRPSGSTSTISPGGPSPNYRKVISEC